MCFVMNQNGTTIRAAWTPFDRDPAKSLQPTKKPRKRNPQKHNKKQVTEKGLDPKIQKLIDVDHTRGMWMFDGDESAPVSCSSHVCRKGLINDRGDRPSLRSRGRRGHDKYKNFRTDRKVDKTGLGRIMRQEPIFVPFI